MEDDAEARYGEFYPPEPDDCVSSADIASAVRRHLKMPDWVDVAVSDDGRWSIRTTDIHSDGEWAVDGQNPDGTGHIDILMEEYHTIVDESQPAKAPEPPDETDQRLAAFRAARGAARPETVMIVSGLDVDEPDDGPIIQVQDRMEDAGKQWHDIHTLIVRSIDRGDVDSLRAARDAMPHLGASMLHLLTAMNRAIEQAE